MTQDPSSNPSRQEKVAAIVSELRFLHARGEVVDDQAVIAKYADLMPELGEEVAKIRNVVEAGKLASALVWEESAARTADSENPFKTSGAQFDSDQRSRVSSPFITIEGYEIRREIASGGQGAVYEGVHAATGRRVAVKIIHSEAAFNPSSRARFEREGQLLARLSHPGIVEVLDRGTTLDGNDYLTMPYIDGMGLDDWIRKANHHGSSALKNPDVVDVQGHPADALKLFIQVCDAVNAAHLLGVVHRDLKPSNIRIDSRGRPIVLDFGLAKPGINLQANDSANPAHTLTGQFLGSLPWASPEQADGDANKLDSRSDVYSLGVILYQMLTGELPYEVCGTMREVLNAICTAQPLPPSAVLAAREKKDSTQRKDKLQSHLNPTIDAIVLKALHKQRDQRYQTAGELGRDVEAYLAGRPTLAKAVPVELAYHWVIARSAIALALLLVIVGAWLFYRAMAGTNELRPQTTVELPKSPASSQPTVHVASRATHFPIDAKGARELQIAAAEMEKREIQTANSLGMKMVFIPQGQFMMGSPTREPGRRRFEIQHRVTLSHSFAIGATPVTQKQWKDLMGTTVLDLRAKAGEEAKDWYMPGMEDDDPVYLVSWDDANEFCRKLSAREGVRYRLPTEAEWEYACRAGTAGACGGTGNFSEMSWYVDTSGRAPINNAEQLFDSTDFDIFLKLVIDNEGKTHPVASKLPNAWGLYDMNGNVLNWCSDFFGEYPLDDATDPPGPLSGRLHVARGGAWPRPQFRCRSANRNWLAANRVGTFLGFRVVRDFN